MSFSLTIRGGDTFERYLNEVPGKATKAARMAVNAALKRGRTLAKKEIMSQVNLKAGYLDGTSSRGKRLGVTLADNNTLTGKITGRREPTSLGRFVEGRNARGQGVQVKVKQRRKTIPKAFLLNLKSGNKGVAIRLAKGETIRNKYGPARKLKSKGRNSDVYLLYAPSIQQILENGTLDRITPEIETYLQGEFLRQFERLAGNR